jgi:hypothetical protein
MSLSGGLFVLFRLSSQKLICNFNPARRLEDRRHLAISEPLRVSNIGCTSEIHYSDLWSKIGGISKIKDKNLCILLDFSLSLSTSKPIFGWIMTFFNNFNTTKQ